MTKNIIDISSWQAGMNLGTVLESNPIDGVVVKATGGASYVQRTCDPWVQELIRENKLWGFYHFLNDDGKKAGGKAEAKWFVENCLNYFGFGLPVADYEHAAIRINYLKDFVREVYELTGVKCLIYCSLSKLHEEDFSELYKEGYPLWIAQYKNMLRTGLQSSPWQSGSISPYDRYVMHQYSSAGEISGYDGYVDLDIFYGSDEDWKNLTRSDRIAYDEPNDSDESDDSDDSENGLIEIACTEILECLDNLHRAIERLRDLLK